MKELIFEPSFFEDEVREGFFVSSMMKRYWAAQLKVLYEIASVCEKHNIRWYAEYGTLLGAVRHGGYIPWDDDLDICMMREDYERFFKVAKEELPKNYQVLLLSEVEEYDEAIGRITNTNVISIDPDHMRKYYGCPYTVGVDVYPLDGLYKDKDKELYRVRRAREAFDELEKAKGDKAFQLRKKIDRIYSECPTTDADNVALMPFYVSYGHHIFPKELYEDSVEMAFENTVVTVNARYEQLLELEYGNYIDVNKTGGLHDYPVYCHQEEVLKEKFGRNPYRYTLDSKALLTSVHRYVSTLLNPKKSNDKKIAVFLPCKAKWWSTMERLWEEYDSNPEYEVHVLPIWYYDCDFEENIGTKHDERLLFPEYIHPEDCTKYDFEGIHPDVIVTQVPYDEHSTFMTVHDFFYSGNLQHFTDELIYVPYVDMDAPEGDECKAATAISIFIEQPAVINSDRVVLNSDKLRDFYVKRLIQMTGEDTSQYWDQKIVSIEKHEKTKEDKKKKVKSQQWEAFLGDMKDRKVMIYHLSIAFLLRDRDKSLDKVKRSLETIKEAGDKICVIFVPQEQILKCLKELDKKLWEEYQQIPKIIKTIPNCIYDEKGVSLEYISSWDAYYGDVDPLVRKCLNANIPVMIENIEV